MEQRPESAERAQDLDDGKKCEAELYVRLCARRLRSGHMQFHWRVEHVDNIDQSGDSLKGVFAPFTMPHEAGQEIASVVRTWWKTTYRQAVTHNLGVPDPEQGEQLTLREFLRD